MSYTAATWDPADVPTARHLASALSLVFQDEGLDADWFLWKHRCNPWGPSVVTYATDDATREVAAVAAFWRWQLHSGDQTCRAFQPCDTATLPTHQRRGLFTLLIHRAADHAQSAEPTYLFGFPNRNSVPGYTNLGWQSAGRLLTLIKPTRFARSIRRVLGRDRAVGSRFVPTALRTPAGSPGDFAGYAALGSPEGNQLAGLRTAEFLTWRFGAHPRNQYAVARDGTVGVIYRTGYRLGVRLVSVEDWECHGAWSVLRGLLHRVARDEDADAIAVTLTEGHAAVRAFRQMGFLQAPGHGQLMTSTLTADSLPPPGHHAWALTGCDIDTH